jgi:hypothetical protein
MKHMGLVGQTVTLAPEASIVILWHPPVQRAYVTLDITVHHQPILTIRNQHLTYVPLDFTVYRKLQTPLDAIQEHTSQIKVKRHVCSVQ